MKNFEVARLFDFMADVLEIKSPDRLMRASAEDLAAIGGVGSAVADSVVKFFGEAGNRRLIARLREAGVTMTEPSGSSG